MVLEVVQIVALHTTLMDMQTLRFKVMHITR
jgi:hypothetical protein